MGAAMNKEDIINMAREAGCEETWGADAFRFAEEELERFAHLVYESVFRDANIAASRTILDAAVLEEREACAKVCDDIGNPWALDCAFTIRTRSNP
jgi:hypothetical protein